MIFTSCFDEQVFDQNDVTVKNDNNHINRIRQPTIKPSKQLPEKAIRLMNAWFTSHEDNPYPNRNDLDYLATNGGIKESQVKAWFSNKRNRTQNTHPKRAKRYLVRTQAQQNSLLLNEPRKIHLADEFEQQAVSLAQEQLRSTVQLSSVHPTNWSWLSPSNPYDSYYHLY